MLNKKQQSFNSTMKPRTKGLCKQSRDRRRGQAAQKKAYAAADDAEQQWCSACGKPGHTDHAHLFTQGRWEAHRNTQQNWIRLCRNCHSLQEDTKAAFAAKFPEVWLVMLEQMLAVDKQAFREFELKNGHLVPLSLV